MQLTMKIKFAYIFISDLSSPDLICNKGATSGTNTDVIPAKVGDEVVFTLDTVSESAFQWPSLPDSYDIIAVRIPPRTYFDVSPSSQIDEIRGWLSY